MEWREVCPQSCVMNKRRNGVATIYLAFKRLVTVAFSIWTRLLRSVLSGMYRDP
jgi:hypothetical protein